MLIGNATPGQGGFDVAPGGLVWLLTQEILDGPSQDLLPAQPEEFLVAFVYEAVTLIRSDVGEKLGYAFGQKAEFTPVLFGLGGLLLGP